MRETETDLKISDDYQTDHEYHHDDALAEMRENAKCITSNIEHYINNTCLTLEIDNIDVVYKGLSEIKDMAYYHYKGDRENRWNKIYQDDFEYNFKEEVKDLLSDELGYIWEEE